MHPRLHRRSLLLLAAVLLLAAACGDSGDPGATTAPPITDTAAPTTATAPPAATTVAPPTTATTTPTTTTTTTTTPTTTTTAPDPFAAAWETLATVIAACNAYSTGDIVLFDGSDADPIVTGAFTGEAAPGVFSFVDGDGVELLVDVNAGVVTGVDGPEGVAPRPYSFLCPPDVFPGTLDEGDPDAAIVDLESGGLGGIGFGAEVEATIADLTAALGAPDEDSDWIGSFSAFGTCPGDEVRVVRWDELQVFFTDSATSVGDYPDPGGPHFFGWLAADFVDGEPPAFGFETAQGVGVGTPLRFVEEAYGEVEVAFDDVFEVWFFEIEDGVVGTLDGDGPDSVVTSLQGGVGCGE